jgi:hypothetical protein
MAMSSVLDKIRRLLEGQQVESYSRYDGQHPLDIFLGIDDSGRKSLVVTLKADKEKVISSKTITVEFFKRNDGRLSLRFSLEDDSLKEIFYKFCEDVIESTRSVNPDGDFSPIIRRWNTWIDFFARTSLPLSESEMIGLIGELYFMKKHMFDKYGVDKSLEAFIGIDKAHKDFEIDDTWFEVKTIHNGTITIKISSIEQLDSDKDGSLVVVTLDQGTLNTDGFITLNGIVAEVRSLLSGNQVIDFDEKMRKANYIFDERYDDFVYVFVKDSFYGVRGDFPRVIGSNLPHGVTKASYEIDLSAIERFKV